MGGFGVYLSVFRNYFVREEILMMLEREDYCLRDVFDVRVEF